MQLSVLRRSVARAVWVLAIAFAIAFGGFGTVTTGVLYGLFLLDAQSQPDFLQFLVSGGYHRIYFAIMFFALLLGIIWFCLVLSSNLRHDEVGTNYRIDSWIRRLDRSDRDAGDR